MNLTIKYITNNLSNTKYVFFRAKLNRIWHRFKNYFINYLSTQNITLEHFCDLLLEPLFKFVDKYTNILGQVS